MSEAVLEAAWPIPADNPYPALAQLRREAPVHYIKGLDCDLVVSHREARAVLSGLDWSADPPRTNEAFTRRLNVSGGVDLLAKSVLFSDPPEHQRLRRALSGHFSPRAVDSMRPRIRSVVEASFRDLPGMDSFDVMGSLAYPVPLAVTCELLDVGVDAAHVILAETSKMTAMLDPLASPDEVDDGIAAAFGVMLELVPLVAQRRARPGDDLLSALVSSGTDPRLETDEAIMMALLLLAAGHETTANLIANAVVCLSHHPHLARTLRQYPEILPQAIEELLRYESPVQLTSRVARNTTRLGETEIEAGTRVLVSIGGANRDPVVFEDPNRIDFSRMGCSHLAFGHGAHFCAGASMARVEAQEVLMCLLSMDPPLGDREVTAQRGTSHTFRNFDILHVSRS